LEPAGKALTSIPAGMKTDLQHLDMARYSKSSVLPVEHIFLSIIFLMQQHKIKEQIFANHLKDDYKLQKRGTTNAGRALSVLPVQ